MSIASYLMKRASNFFGDRDLRKENLQLARDVEWHKKREAQLHQLAEEKCNEVWQLILAKARFREAYNDSNAAAFRQLNRMFHLISKRLSGKCRVRFEATLGRDDARFYLKDGLKLGFSAKTIIGLFCELLGITEEQLWENINFDWKARLQKRADEDYCVSLVDSFTDLPSGILSSVGHCGMHTCAKKQLD